MGCWNSRAVENLLGKPVTHRCRAACVRARLSVRHVHDLLHAVLACGLSKNRRCLHRTLCQWVAEVDAVNTLHRATDIFDLQHVTGHNFRAQFLQYIRTAIFTANESPNRVTVFQQETYGRNACRASGPCDEKLLHIDLRKLRKCGQNLHVVSARLSSTIIMLRGEYM